MSTQQGWLGWAEEGAAEMGTGEFLRARSLTSHRASSSGRVLGSASGGRCSAARPCCARSSLRRRRCSCWAMNSCSWRFRSLRSAFWATSCSRSRYRRFSSDSHSRWRSSSTCQGKEAPNSRSQHPVPENHRTRAQGPGHTCPTLGCPPEVKCPRHIPALPPRESLLPSCTGNPSKNPTSHHAGWGERR